MRLGFLIAILLACQLFSLQTIPVYASPPYGLADDHPLQTEQPAISSLPEEAKNPALFSEYTQNERAVMAVEKKIGYFQKISDRFSLWLSRSGKYHDLMKEILNEKEIPEEIFFLALIESGFNPYAYSPKRAVGYWQFVASTAKRYGLEINWWKDERRDPVKSTIAAANYLNDLYEMFGCWNLAMAAYNAGEGKILKALNRTKKDDYWSLVHTKYLRRETKEYIPKFIAANIIASNPQEFGFENLEYHPPLEFDEVTIPSPVDLEVAAECAETTVEVIKELNPELRRWCTPPDVPEYTLRIPAGIKDTFLENLSRTPEEERFSIDIYKVKKGDTFKKISKKTGIPLQVILDLNSLEKIIPLKEGMKIHIPPKGKFVLDRDDRASIKKASYKQKKLKTKRKNKRA